MDLEHERVVDYTQLALGGAAGGAVYVGEAARHGQAAAVADVASRLEALRRTNDEGPEDGRLGAAELVLNTRARDELREEVRHAAEQERQVGTHSSAGLARNSVALLCN